MCLPQPTCGGHMAGSVSGEAIKVLQKLGSSVSATHPSGFAALEAYELMAHLLQRARPLGLPPAGVERVGCLPLADDAYGNKETNSW